MVHYYQLHVNISMGFPGLLDICSNILILHSVLIILELLLIRECVCISWDSIGVGNPPYV